jgi:hypothetical protein
MYPSGIVNQVTDARMCTTTDVPTYLPLELQNENLPNTQFPVGSTVPRGVQRYTCPQSTPLL